VDFIAQMPEDGSLRLPEPAKHLLTAWYESHVRHPYPQPDELRHLVTATGQTRRKVYYPLLLEPHTP